NNFPCIQLFPGSFHGKPLQLPQNVPKAPSFSKFSAWKTLSKPSSQLFRSARQLPFAFPRFSNLSAAPAPIPSRNQFWFRAPLIFLVPAVLLLTFFAIRHSRPDESLALSPASHETNWQAAMDFSPASTSASRRAIFPYSVIPGGVRDANELQSASSKD